MDADPSDAPPPVLGPKAELWIKRIGEALVLAGIVELLLGWVGFGLGSSFIGVLVVSLSNLDEQNSVMVKHISSLKPKRRSEPVKRP